MMFVHRVEWGGIALNETSKLKCTVIHFWLAALFAFLKVAER
jgi:hypothetical protein